MPILTALADHRVARLFVLDFGLFDVGGKRVIGIPGFLVETDRGARVLIDTGFPPDYADPASDIAERDGLGRFGRLLGFGPQQTAIGQLALLDLTPADMDAVILTHGHIDHVGSLPLFAHAPIIMTQAERAHPRPLYFSTACPMEWPEATYYLIDGETDLCAGLRLIPTPGHTDGHLSVLVGLPETGPVLLVADAINRASEPAEGFPDADDPATAAQSAAHLFDLRNQTGAWLIYGHEPGQWPELRKAPAAYS